MRNLPYFLVTIIFVTNRICADTFIPSHKITGAPSTHQVIVAVSPPIDSSVTPEFVAPGSSHVIKGNEPHKETTEKPITLLETFKLYEDNLRAQIQEIMTNFHNIPSVEERTTECDEQNASKQTTDSLLNLQSQLEVIRKKIQQLLGIKQQIQQGTVNKEIAPTIPVPVQYELPKETQDVPNKGYEAVVENEEMKVERLGEAVKRILNFLKTLIAQRDFINSQIETFLKSHGLDEQSYLKQSPFGPINRLINLRNSLNSDIIKIVRLSGLESVLGFHLHLTRPNRIPVEPSETQPHVPSTEHSTFPLPLPFPLPGLGLPLPGLGLPLPGLPLPGLGLPLPGLPLPGLPLPGLPLPGLPLPGLPLPGSLPGLPLPGLPSPGLPSPGLPSPVPPGSSLTSTGIFPPTLPFPFPFPFPFPISAAHLISPVDQASSPIGHTPSSTEQVSSNVEEMPLEEVAEQSTPLPEMIQSVQTTVVPPKVEHNSEKVSTRKPTKRPTKTKISTKKEVVQGSPNDLISLLTRQKELINSQTDYIIEIAEAEKKLMEQVYGLGTVPIRFMEKDYTELLTALKGQIDSIEGQIKMLKTKKNHEYVEIPLLVQYGLPNYFRTIEFRTNVPDQDVINHLTAQKTVIENELAKLPLEHLKPKSERIAFLEVLRHLVNDQINHYSALPRYYTFVGLPRYLYETPIQVMLQTRTNFLPILARQANLMDIQIKHLEMIQSAKRKLEHEMHNFGLTMNDKTSETSMTEAITVIKEEKDMIDNRIKEIFNKKQENNYNNIEIPTELLVASTFSPPLPDYGISFNTLPSIEEKTSEGIPVIVDYSKESPGVLASLYHQKNTLERQIEVLLPLREKCNKNPEEIQECDKLNLLNNLEGQRDLINIQIEEFQKVFKAIKT